MGIYYVYFYIYVRVMKIDSFNVFLDFKYVDSEIK